MAKGINGFEEIMPNMKDEYSSKLQKITEKPNNSKKYFGYLKRKLRKLQVPKIKTPKI